MGLGESHTATDLSKTRRNEAAADGIARGRYVEQPRHHCRHKFQERRRPFSEFEPRRRLVLNRALQVNVAMAEFRQTGAQLR